MATDPKATSIKSSLDALSAEIVRLDAEVAKIDAGGDKGFKDDVDRLKQLREEVAQGLDSLSGEHAGDDLVRTFDVLYAAVQKLGGKVG